MARYSYLGLIEKKKAKVALSESEIAAWVEGVTTGDVPDYQSSALLMAIRLNGMDFDETLALTQAMASSGEVLTFKGYPILSDKHSTGGVGDKVTLVLAPLLAACGLPVTMLSGRGLGFTGGTIDKLQALKGVSCNQDGRRLQEMLDQFGWANAQASENVVPADRKLYALRDVTGTVDSIPLITASILSKKLAGGATHLFMDVKCGESAFMPDLDSAEKLAENLKTIGTMGGLSVQGAITRMEEPLGHAVGNYLELLESVLYLKKFPATPLMDLIFDMGERMLLQGGIVPDSERAQVLMRSKMKDGTALERLEAYLQFTGADPSALKSLLDRDLDSFHRVPVISRSSGKVQAIKGRFLGETMIDLGGARKTQADQLDYDAGMVLNKHLGDEVEKGDVLLWLYGSRAGELEHLHPLIEGCYQLGDASNPVDPLLIREF